VAETLQLRADFLKTIELAVNHRGNRLIFIRDRLRSRQQVDSAQTGVAKRNSPVFRLPKAYAIWTSMP
jgi:hypothetical protein